MKQTSNYKDKINNCRLVLKFRSVSSTLMRLSFLIFYRCVFIQNRNRTGIDFFFLRTGTNIFLKRTNKNK